MGLNQTPMFIETVTIMCNDYRIKYVAFTCHLSLPVRCVSRNLFSERKIVVNLQVRTDITVF